jgi:hypothetical protein
MLNTRISQNYNDNDVINANDLRKRIINVDSSFRADLNESTTDFTYKLEHPYKNLIRLRLASVEIPNMFYVFTKKNNRFTIKVYDHTNKVIKETIIIKEGNYTSSELIETIQTKLNEKLLIPYGIFINIDVDTINAKVTFTHNGLAEGSQANVLNPVPVLSASPFIIDFCNCESSGSCDCDIIPDSSKKQRSSLGYHLGFRQKFYKIENSTISSLKSTLTAYTITSENCINVVGNTYMLLSVNDFYCVEQRTDETYIQCLAKIIIREEKYTMIYDDGSSFMSNEIIFPSPVDLKILQVKLLDPYGELVDLCGLNFSFSLEITEVLNTKLYDFYRNYIWLGNVPSVNPKKVKGSAQPLLCGVGPPW